MNNEKYQFFSALFTTKAHELTSCLFNKNEFNDYHYFYLRVSFEFCVLIQDITN